MEYKQLGDTELRVPEIGLGTWTHTGVVGRLLNPGELPGEKPRRVVYLDPLDLLLRDPIG